MSNSGKQSPLGVNVQGSILNNQGFAINPVAASITGSSKTNADYTFGKLVQDTVLRLQTWAINDAYLRNLVTRTSSTDTYDNLINIGSTSIPALGNSKPPTYTVQDPSNIWTTTAQNYGAQKGVIPSLPGPANSGYALTSNTDQGQQATWYPYTGVSGTNPNTSITQWGYTRLHALQAWQEFNWNGNTVDAANPEYKEFASSVLTADSFITNSNQSVFAMQNSKTFLEGTYSNMNDLISADISGVSLSTKEFGTDLINLGNAIDLANIDSFGLPSNLLRTLYKNNALTDDIVLSLLAVGVTNNDINAITTGKSGYISSKTQQQIYGAFVVTVGESLINPLAVLKCKTPGIESLADLLNVKKLFPNSYSTLTVPIYNIAPGPTNSKTYYLIYAGGSINSQLTSPEINAIVGAQTIAGTPPVTENTVDGTNYTLPPIGLGSYLFNIIPQADAIAAGAFAYSMQQVRNIKFCDIEIFAQVVRSIETTISLSLVNGTNKPVDEQLANTGLSFTALGSGIYGTYTMSDFFGCMSGLPYPWQLIYQRITELQTQTLANIYRDNFLAVTWEAATVTVQYTSYQVEDPPGIFTTYYTVTGVTLTNDGGGYGRGNAPAPTITISGGSGATAIATIGTNDSDAASNGAGTFGRVTSVTLTSAGTDTTTIPTITIQCPPTTVSGTNTSEGTVGWPSPMNAVVQSYIDQANAEIASIQSNNPNISRILNTYWNVCGVQLAREQRARYIALPPVAVVPVDSSTIVRKDYFLNLYPSSLYTFTDSIPTLAQDTKPHGAAQTLEAISDLCGPGGQSIVALMRESRNKNRLSEVGIPQDNNIPDALTDTQLKQLTTNGVLPDQNGIQGECNSYTMPSWPNTTDCGTGQILTPIPNGVFTDNSYKQTAGVTKGDITPILTECGDISVSTIIPVGPIQELPVSEPYIIAVPIQVNPAIPPELDTSYTSSTLLPSSPSIQEAIDQVIECNCDCWVN